MSARSGPRSARMWLWASRLQPDKDARVKVRISGWLAGGLVFLFIIALGIGFAALRSRGKGTGETSSRSLPPVVGSPVPEFELNSLDGTPQKLSSLKGTPVMVNFWATWCPPCKQEMPLLEKVGKQYAGKMVILGVDYEEQPGVVQPFVRQMGITYPVLFDRTGSVAASYFVKDFPYTFFIDRDGVLRAQKLGILSEEQLVQYLKTIGIEP